MRAIVLILLVLARICAAEPERITVVTYNVLEHPHHRQERIPALLKVLERAEADVYLLQEVMPWFAGELTAQPWTKAYRQVEIAGEPLPQGQFFVLSRWPIVGARLVEMPTNLGRCGLVVDLDIGGRRWCIGNVHLESTLEDGPLRAQQMRAMFAALHVSGDGLLAGDFNFGDGEAEGLALDPGFTDVWKAVRPKEPGFTWDLERSAMAKDGSFPTETSRRLDRILVHSAFWRPGSATLLGDQSIAPGSPVFPSDHFGLRVELTR